MLGKITIHVDPAVDITKFMVHIDFHKEETFEELPGPFDTVWEAVRAAELFLMKKENRSVDPATVSGDGLQPHVRLPNSYPSVRLVPDLPNLTK